MAAVPPVEQLRFEPNQQEDAPEADNNQDSPAQENTNTPEPAPVETPSLQPILDAARRILDSCREADAAEEERLKAAAAVHRSCKFFLVPSKTLQ